MLALRGGGRAVALSAAATGSPSSSSHATPTPSRSIKSLAAGGGHDKWTAQYEPWDYRNRGYSKWNMLTDGTKKRLNTNSKIIVIEGNIGVGKSSLAKQLARDLDFHHIPEFSTENVLVNSYGVDQRSFFNDIPFTFQIPDARMFYTEPEKHNLVRMQYMMLYGRQEQHHNAMAHVLNTGQGVVMERSIYSDFVFVNAMYAKGLISEQFFRLYHYMRRHVMANLKFHPHLFIYLDAPVDTCLAGIRERGRDEEKASAFLDKEYLTVISDSYRDMLAEMQRHSKMILYDWPALRDASDIADRVVEDVEAVDLDFFETMSMTEMEAWNMVFDDPEWCRWRHYFTSKHEPMNYLYHGDHSLFKSLDVPELINSFADQEQYVAVMSHKAFKDGYAYGFHPDDLAKNWHNIFGADYGMARYAAWPWQPTGWFEYFYKDVFFSVWNARRHFWGLRSWDGRQEYTPDYANAHH